MQADGPVGDGQRVPGALDPRPDGEDVGGRPGRLRFEPADEQQLLDHPRQPVGLVRDDRQPRVGLLIGRRERLGVRPDRGQRRLQVVADAAQEVVLDLAQLAQLDVLLLDLGEQLGVADGDADLAGVQVEQGLVGPLPGLASPAGWPG